MRKLLKNSVTCRHCKTVFNKIKGKRIHDEHCCSDRCFLYSGPKATLPIITVPYIYKGKKKSPYKSSKSQISSRNFYASPEWGRVRYDILAKYGRKCMACGQTDGIMQVDHIIPRSLRPDLALVFDNLQVLCKVCNEGKSNRHSKDHRGI